MRWWVVVTGIALVVGCGDSSSPPFRGAGGQAGTGVPGAGGTGGVAGEPGTGPNLSPAEILSACRILEEEYCVPEYTGILWRAYKDVEACVAAASDCPSAERFLLQLLDHAWDTYYFEGDPSAVPPGGTSNLGADDPCGSLPAACPGERDACYFVNGQVPPECAEVVPEV